MVDLEEAKGLEGWDSVAGMEVAEGATDSEKAAPVAKAAAVGSERAVPVAVVGWEREEPVAKAAVVGSETVDPVAVAGLERVVVAGSEEEAPADLAEAGWEVPGEQVRAVAVVAEALEAEIGYCTLLRRTF